MAACRSTLSWLSRSASARAAALPVAVSLPPERLAEAEVGLGRGRLDADRLAELGDRAVDVPLLAEDRAEQVVRLRVVRRARDRGPAGLGGLVRSVRLPEQHGERVDRVGQGRVELGRAAQRDLGLGERVLLLQREAEVVEGEGVLGRAGHVSSR